MRHLFIAQLRIADILGTSTPAVNNCEEREGWSEGGGDSPYAVVKISVRKRVEGNGQNRFLYYVTVVKMKGKFCSLLKRKLQILMVVCR